MDYIGVEEFYRPIGDTEIIKTKLQKQYMGKYTPVVISPILFPVTEKEYFEISLHGHTSYRREYIVMPERSILAEYIQAKQEVAGATPGSDYKQKLSKPVRKIWNQLSDDVVAFHQGLLIEDRKDRYLERKFHLIIPGTVYPYQTIADKETTSISFRERYNVRQGLFEIFTLPDGYVPSRSLIDLLPVVHRALDGKYMPLTNLDDSILNPRTAEIAYTFKAYGEGFRTDPYVRGEFYDLGAPRRETNWPAPYDKGWPRPEQR